jgi:hypothetical protein
MRHSTGQSSLEFTFPQLIVVGGEFPPGFVAVYTSAIAAHAIPRRAFASDEQLNQFVAMVRERMRARSSERRSDRRMTLGIR